MLHVCDKTEQRRLSIKELNQANMKYKLYINSWVCSAFAHAFIYLFNICYIGLCLWAHCSVLLIDSGRDCCEKQKTIGGAPAFQCRVSNDFAMAWGKLFDYYSCSADREQFHELGHAFYDPLAASQHQGLVIISEPVCRVLSSKITKPDYGNLLE